MSTGLQTEVLIRAEANIANGADQDVVADSITSLEDRKVYGVLITSNMGPWAPSGVALSAEVRLDLEVSFNGVPLRAGSMAKLRNVITEQLQGNVTPNDMIIQRGRQIYCAFDRPFDWARGVAINLLAYEYNDTGDAIEAEGEAIIYYTS